MADFVTAHELTVLPHTVTLGYEMLTADQVLKRLLPEGMDVPSSFEQVTAAPLTLLAAVDAD